MPNEVQVDTSRFGEESLVACGLLRDRLSLNRTLEICWDEFERIQRLIAENAISKGSEVVKGAVRQGDVLLAGLFRCGHCGRKLHVHYSRKIGRYNYYGERMNHGTERCISIGSCQVGAVVAKEVLRVITPLGIDAAVKVIEAQALQATSAGRQLELAMQQARFEVAYAPRQYDAVDPANRLVARELERRWNEALEAVDTVSKRSSCARTAR